MAKHKHKKNDSPKNKNGNMNNNTNKSLNNNPFGIDPLQIMGLLGGNLDMSNIGNILSSMNTNGFNLGNLDPFPNMMNNNGMMNTNGAMNNSGMKKTNPNYPIKNDLDDELLNVDSQDVQDTTTKEKNKKTSHKGSSNEKNIIFEADDNLAFLEQLRNYIHPKQAKLIDKIIQMYKEGKIKDV